MFEYYNELWKVRDKRVDGWFLMGSVWPTIIMCVGYYYFAKIGGPQWMKNKKPMEFKGLMHVYNIFQVGACMYMWISTWKGGWLSRYNWICQDVERDTDPNSPAMLMAATCHYFYLSKLLDFVDTIFFVIRKKEKQMTNLHIIHHTVMPIYTWIGCRWLPGGHETFTALINCFIHVCMYSYYFLSSLGPWIQPYLWWKRYLTSMQMIQFIMIGSKSLLVVSGIAHCGFPWQWSLVTLILMIMFYHLFNEFYKTAYKTKADNKSGHKVQ